MPNRWNPGCGCCECWKTTEDYGITTSSVSGGLLFSDQMPSSSQWTSLFEPLSSAGLDSDSFIFGANSTLTTGYRIDQTRSTTSNGAVTKYTIELYNLGTASVEATKEFHALSSSLNWPVYLHAESCLGQPYTTTINVVVRDVFCFSVEVSGTHWGVDNSAGIYSAFGYGSKDRLLVASNDDPCHLCGVQEHSFGSSSGVCVGDTIRVTISDLPSSYSFSPDLLSITYDITNVSGNGTYNVAAKCPDCRYPNVLAEITYDASTDGGLTTTSKTVPIYCLSNVVILAPGDRRFPVSPVLAASDIRLIEPRPQVLDEYFSHGSDDGLGTKYQATGLCKWEKYKRNTAINGRSWPEREARIVVEYV